MKYLFTGLLVLSFCFANAVSFAQTIHFDHAFTIGKEESDSTQYLFSGPKEIITADDGSVYIADGSSNAIRVFNQEGYYLTSVGRRGRGPGEYQSINHMSMDQDNNLHVLDRRLNRVTIVPNSLGDSETFIIRDRFTDPFALYPLPSGDYLVFATGPQQGSGPLKLAYIFDKKFETAKDNFLTVHPYISGSKESFFKTIFSSPFYESTFFGEGKIALTHENYGGQLAIIEPGSNNKVRVKGNWNRNNFEILDWNKRDQYRRNNMRGLETTSMGGGLVFRSTSSVGLVGNSNYLVHFYAPLEDNRRISKMDIFDAEGTKITTVELNDTDLNLYQENGRIGLVPKHLDEQNQIYFADYTQGQGFPVVRVVAMNVQK